ncbi:amino acid aminotransferase [Mesorhizobium sp. B2-4-17]|uniref:amino acid aminotransferase n=1 Tax=Mesorhizobium sp. B2-4-17 TaxID=2589932 RepID=UPI00112A6F35|nr:amino acid aminotransferase [Mesorhizobium sp. B2-4-17]TPK91504.1 aspartate/tyrosine/aromatic aminotransferase [Mesorhizobium sp. B2-4-17]
MFESFSPAEPDSILELMGLYRDDPRSAKVDLGVGVYKDEQGRTPIMSAVRRAQARLLVEQTTKTYLGSAGDTVFNSRMIELLFGHETDGARLCSCQTPGGSGALRTLIELLASSRSGATVWIPDPSWPNHAAVVAAARANLRTYPYVDPATNELRFEEMIEALKAANPGDVVLLHGCCHNPTGVDLDLSQWTLLTELLAGRELFPLVDMAYQGFGDGLEEDAAGLRKLAAIVPELGVAASCSKNFGVYRDRVGVAALLGRNAEETEKAFGQLLGKVRTMYSMPPDHGAAVVRIVLEDPSLRGDWTDELEEMRRRIVNLRSGFAAALRHQTNTDRYDFIAHQRGMFSRIGATREQVDRLRSDYAVYIGRDGRINMAGLPEHRLDELSIAFASVLDRS